MTQNFQIINETKWPRAQHCAVFRNCIEPAFCITLELDVTHFLKTVHETGCSFTMALMYAVTDCANKIENFRYRFVDGNVVLFETIDTAFTYLDKKTELFKVVTVPFTGTMAEFAITAAKAAEAQKDYFTGPLGTDVFQFSPLPWISYTHISHTISGKKDSATPLFDWGKYTEKDGIITLPFSIQAHHSFVDGLHVGKLADSLQKYLDTIRS